MFTDFDQLLDRPQQGSSEPVRPVIETTDTTSEHESDACLRKKTKVLSKRTFRRKKVRASEEIALLFVTGSTDPVAKPSQFYCTLCQRDVSMLTH